MHTSNQTSKKAQVKKPDDNCQRRVTTDGLDRIRKLVWGMTWLRWDISTSRLLDIAVYTICKKAKLDAKVDIEILIFLKKKKKKHETH